MMPPLIEPPDMAPDLRHHVTMETRLAPTDKLPFVYAHGTPQTMDGVEMLAMVRGLADAEFAAQGRCCTIISTNAPRQLDIPMAQGPIDVARAGQVAIVTPFTLMGAMAPITVAGAVTLSHAEAPGSIALAQLPAPGRRCSLAPSPRRWT